MPSQFRSFRTRVLLPAASIALGACGSGDGYQDNGGGGGAVVPLEAKFSSIQANVFTPICEQCHSGASAPRGLRLDALNSYGLLVGLASSEEPGLQRVQPGDPVNSYLIRKLEGTAGTGERMPAGLPALPQATIDVIKQWITDGALRDTAPSNGPIRVTSLAPAPDTTVATLPASITVVLDRELNATTVDATTVLVARSGGDGVFEDGNDVAVAAASVTVPAGNSSSILVSLAGVASLNDLYRVTVRGTGAAKILDLDGNALDGDFAGAFPSGNGAAGGDFVAEFTVGALTSNLQSIQDNVLTPICAGCHAGGGATLPTSMNLTNATTSRAALVGIASVEVPALQRVQPGNADDSYLIRKLEGTPGIVGLRMPRNAPPLDQVSVNAIRQWIDNGAQ